MLWSISFEFPFFKLGNTMTPCCWSCLATNLEDHSGCKWFGSPPFTSHDKNPFGRGPASRSLGDNNDHHGLFTTYFILGWSSRSEGLPVLPNPPRWSPQILLQVLCKLRLLQGCRPNFLHCQSLKKSASWGTLAVAPPAFSPVIPTPVPPHVMIWFWLWLCVYIYIYIPSLKLTWPLKIGRNPKR